MNCPICSAKLAVVDQNGIEACYCEECNGAWLDRSGFVRAVKSQAPEPKPIRIPSLSSQRQANFELLYEG